MAASLVLTSAIQTPGTPALQSGAGHVQSAAALLHQQGSAARFHQDSSAAQLATMAGHLHRATRVIEPPLAAFAVGALAGEVLARRCGENYLTCAAARGDQRLSLNV